VLDTFRKIFYLVGRDNPARWAALIAGAAVASGLEVFGALLVYLLLGLVVESGAAVQIPLVGDPRSYFAGVDDTTFMLWAASGAALFFVLRAAYQIVFAYMKHRLAHNAGARLSSRLAAGYLALPYRYHLHRRSSELVRNAQQTVVQLSEHCFLQAIIVVAEMLVILGLLLVMLLVAPIPTVIAVAVLAAAALLLLKLVQPKLRSLGEQAQEQRKLTLASLQQALTGIRDIKVLGVSRAFGEVYRSSFDQLARAMYLRGTILDLPRLVIETSLILFIVVLFSISVASGVATQELLSTLGLLAYVGLRLQPSLQKLVHGLNYVRFSAQAVEDVAADLRLIEAAEPVSDDVRPLPYLDEVHVDHVSFTYEGADRPALRDIDLRISRGEMIGLCGPTGGGKTTLVDVIVGLLEPTDGRVTVDGIDIAEVGERWFRSLGVVHQMVFLVDDTLRRNIALGLQDEAIDNGAVARAIRDAQLDDVIDELPDGVQTVVGERGVRMSGGQRQRIAIARALYRNPAVLVLDEGTSALDTSTEAVLVDAIERDRGERTIIMIAHRLSTLRRCDRVILVSDGAIRASGSYQDLSERSPEFANLIASSAAKKPS
jgi:ATP-binding cassette, subfamily B, bacterial PglK